MVVKLPHYVHPSTLYFYTCKFMDVVLVWREAGWVEKKRGWMGGKETKVSQGVPLESYIM